MIRRPVEKVKYVSELTVKEVEETYKEIGAAVECNDGKPKTVVWEV